MILQDINQADADISAGNVCFRRGASWRLVSPAPMTVALALAGPTVRGRRGVLAQVRNYESVAVYLGDVPVALMMFRRHGWRRTEIALALTPDAGRYVKRLIRMARVTLSAMAERHLVIAYVHPANPAGARLAALAGFRRSKLKRQRYIWVFRRDRPQSPCRRA